MLDCCKVAVTGTIASGKSSVCYFLKKLGAYVTSADAIVHRLLVSDAKIGQLISDLLGKNVIVNGQLDRGKIAEKVFNNSTLLDALEATLHPAVQQEITAQYQLCKADHGVKLFVAEVPLLYETNTQPFFDQVVVVSANQRKCQERFVSTTRYSIDHYQRRLSRLMPLTTKEKKADFILPNNGSLQELYGAVRSLFPKLCQRLPIEQE